MSAFFNCLYSLVLFSSMIQAITYTYLGCYNNTEYQIDSIGDYSMTLSICAEYCAADGYVYFALNNGNTCDCGPSLDDAGTKVDNKYCNLPCGGDSDIYCGNTRESYSIWEISGLDNNSTTTTSNHNTYTVSLSSSSSQSTKTSTNSSSAAVSSTNTASMSSSSTASTITTASSSSASPTSTSTSTVTSSDSSDNTATASNTNKANKSSGKSLSGGAIAGIVVGVVVGVVLIALVLFFFYYKRKHASIDEETNNFAGGAVGAAGLATDPSTRNTGEGFKNLDKFQKAYSDEDQNDYDGLQMITKDSDDELEEEIKGLASKKVDTSETDKLLITNPDK